MAGFGGVGLTRYDKGMIPLNLARPVWAVLLVNIVQPLCMFDTKMIQKGRVFQPMVFRIITG